MLRSSLHGEPEPGETTLEEVESSHRKPGGTVMNQHRFNSIGQGVVDVSPNVPIEGPDAERVVPREILPRGLSGIGHEEVKVSNHDE